MPAVTLGSSVRVEITQSSSYLPSSSRVFRDLQELVQIEASYLVQQHT